MEVRVKVIDRRKYNVVKMVDTSELEVRKTDVFYGRLLIELQNGENVPYYGLVLSDHFEEQYGFILIKSNLI